PCGTRRAGGTNQLASLNKQAALPVLALRGNYIIEGDEIFQLRKIPNGVRAEKTFTNGLHVVKDFRLGTNYVLSATLRFENQSQEPIQLPRHELVTGTATPIGTNASPNSLGFYCYDGSRAE